MTSKQEAGWTEGPWEVSPARIPDVGFMVVGGPGQDFGLIAEVTEERDAHLIKAAPELYEALEAMLAEWDKVTRYGSPLAKAANERVAFARQALSSATPCGKEKDGLPELQGGDALRALPQTTEGQPSWRPIESAPKDGTPVLVCIAGLPQSSGEAYWWQDEEGRGGWQTIDGANHTRTVYTTPPTHWMPRPDPPAAREAEGQPE